MVDPIQLSQQLMRCKSIAPEDAGALDILQRALEGLGFNCHRMTFEEDDVAPVQNLYARLGTKKPNLCFAGHTDVVPEGNADDLYDQAVALVIKENKVSISYIQRQLRIGYNRAATIVETMEREGVISAASPTGKRSILVPVE